MYGTDVFPTPYTVQRIPRTKVGENAVGQPIYTEGSPIPVAVHYFEPVSQEERYAAALAGRTVSDVRMGSPTDSFRPSDAVVYRGVTYEVDGETADYTRGPFVPGFGGFVIGLRKVTNA